MYQHLPVHLVPVLSEAIVNQSLSFALFICAAPKPRRDGRSARASAQQRLGRGAPRCVLGRPPQTLARRSAQRRACTYLMSAWYSSFTRWLQPSPSRGPARTCGVAPRAERRRKPWPARCAPAPSAAGSSSRWTACRCPRCPWRPRAASAAQQPPPESEKRRPPTPPLRGRGVQRSPAGERTRRRGRRAQAACAPRQNRLRKARHEQASPAALSRTAPA